MSKKGFTLVELIVCVTICFILAGIFFAATGTISNPPRTLSMDGTITTISTDTLVVTDASNQRQAFALTLSQYARVKALPPMARVRINYCHESWGYPQIEEIITAEPAHSSKLENVEK